MEADERTEAQLQLGRSLRLDPLTLRVMLDQLSAKTAECNALFNALRGPMSVAGLQLPRELIFAQEMLYRTFEFFKAELAHLKTGRSNGFNRPE